MQAAQIAISAAETYLEQAERAGELATTSSENRAVMKSIAFSLLAIAKLLNTMTDMKVGR